ncbi:hypothetical protein ABK040_001567 [Willaertia magna]
MIEVKKLFLVALAGVFSLWLGFVSCSDSTEEELYDIIYNNDTSKFYRVKQILNVNSSIANERFGWFLRTPLQMALQNHNIHFVKLLVNYKADPNIKDGSGWSAWKYAAHYDMLEELAKLKIPQNTETNYAFSSLFIISVISAFAIGTLLSFFFRNQIVKILPNSLQERFGVVVVNNNRSERGQTSSVNNNQELQEQLTEPLRPELECSICMDSKKEVVLNCGHCLCQECSKRSTICPICRTRITKTTRIFL